MTNIKEPEDEKAKFSVFNSSDSAIIVTTVILAIMMLGSILMLNKIFDDRNNLNIVTKEDTIRPESLAKTDEELQSERIILTTINTNNNIVSRNLLKDTVVNTFRLPEQCPKDDRDILRTSLYPTETFIKNCNEKVIVFDSGQLIHEIDPELISDTKENNLSDSSIKFNQELNILGYINQSSQLVLIDFTESDPIKTRVNISGISNNTESNLNILAIDEENKEILIRNIGKTTDKLVIYEIEANTTKNISVELGDDIKIDTEENLYYQKINKVFKYQRNDFVGKNVYQSENNESIQLDFVSNTGEFIGVIESNEFHIINANTGKKLITYIPPSNSDSDINYRIISGNQNLMLIQALGNNFEENINITIVTRSGEVSSYNSNADRILGTNFTKEE